MDKSAVLKGIRDCGVIAIFRAESPEGLLEAAEAVLAGGITAIEFTLNTPQALKLIGAGRERLGERALVGAGTVLSAAAARQAIREGAQFILSPALQREVVEAAQEAGVAVIPGAYTPSEVLTAWEWGADLVKLFPASAGGPAYLRALRAPLPHIPLVPTGGVNAANAGEYIRAGAVAVAAGGNLARRAAIEAGEFFKLSEAAREFTAVVRESRQGVTP